ncbi:NACHT, LRR and PYD domains-containing protein 1b allele 5-like [Poeciliopsis prolifica]|uniref:NACHT, LRR and PYD domains-containing protein 1b allele 5-like n=1 Tax=Poeciliopsis prolifica TaxID=188132 RepID=UPI00241467F1|nr:NACHT, LRR and PYD domains-containing protein 1b allele 5-like [Poeciliopsis prolifica]
MQELLSRMRRPDLEFALIKSTEKKSVVGKWKSAPIQKVATMAAVKNLLLETVDRLNPNEFQEFKRFLQPTAGPDQFPHTRTWSPAEIQNRTDLVRVMVEEEGAGSVERTRSIFRDMNRTDLLQMLPRSRAGMKETSTSVDSVDCGSVEQDSSSWTKVDPELDGTSPDEDPTYSLQSAAGHFECSVSGLRWVCREKVGFRYRFCSWVGHMERMESRGYRPAGPLLDISVLTGKVMEVQLPHWVCTDDVPELLKNFAVLHVGDCGDVLEKATRVTKTHVGLTEPVFSLLGALRNLFFSPRIICNTLIYYQPKTSYLKMHVYLIPPDPALKQEITLRPDSQDPNFYEVFIESPDENFNLELLQTHSEKVWFCEIRKDDHPKSGSTGGGGCSTETVTVKKEEEHFVDKHRETLIQRVRNVEPVLDGLLQNKVLMEETYDRIRSLPTSEAQLREIFSCLRAADECKDIFLSILQEKEPHLITDLQRKC